MDIIEELKKVAFRIIGTKVLGPEGFQAIFY